MNNSIPNHLDQKSRVILTEVLQISRFLLTNGDEDVLHQRQQKRLLSLQNALKEITHPICRDLLPLEKIPAKVRDAFVKATILLN